MQWNADYRDLIAPVFGRLAQATEMAESGADIRSDAFVATALGRDTLPRHVGNAWRALIDLPDAARERVIEAFQRPDRAEQVRRCKAALERLGSAGSFRDIDDLLNEARRIPPAGDATSRLLEPLGSREDFAVDRAGWKTLGM